MNIETATVINNKLVDDKFREGNKVRVINLNTYKGKESVWIKNIQTGMSLAAGNQVQVIRNDKGKLSILEQSAPRQVNGNGLQPVGDTLNGNAQEQLLRSEAEQPMKTNSAAYQVYSNEMPTEESTITNGHSQEAGLTLPILNDTEKVQLKQYVTQQVNMFNYIISEVSKKFPELKSSDHRAIAMSVFIDSNRIIQQQK